MDWENINVQFGLVLRKIREARHLSQEDLADLCGISRAYYGRIERGEHSATLDLCKKLADGLGLTLSAMFEDLIE